MRSFLKNILTFAILILFVVCSISGCGSSNNVDAFGSGSGSASGGTEAGFEIPGQAAMGDFDWAFNPRSYDKSNEIAFKNPDAAAGVWEMAVWRFTGKKGVAQKELYWVNIQLEGRDGKILDADPEIYANLAFKDSEEAKNAGLQGSDTASRLLEAMQAGDGSVKAYVTVILEGIEDNDGNWKSIGGKPVRLEGKYYPEMMFLKVEDKKGNEITAHNFLTSGKEQHAEGGFTPAGNKPGLHGVTYFIRKIK